VRFRFLERFDGVLKNNVSLGLSNVEVGRSFGVAGDAAVSPPLHLEEKNLCRASTNSAKFIGSWIPDNGDSEKGEMLFNVYRLSLTENKARQRPSRQMVQARERERLPSSRRLQAHPVE
jgi:hypothetical protein